MANELTNQGFADALSAAMGGTRATATFLTDIQKAGSLTLANDEKTNAGRALGMESEEMNYQNSMLALTDPKKYAESRLTAYKAIKTAVNAEYEAVFKEMSEIGQSKAVAEHNALTAAARKQALKLESFRMMYPETANAISNTKMSQNTASNFGGMPAGRTTAPIGGGSVGGGRRTSRRKGSRKK